MSNTEMMKRDIAVYLVDGGMVELPEPDRRTMMEHLDSLDGLTNEHIHLTVDKAWIGINASREGNIHFTYGGTSGGANFANGILINPEETDTDEIKYQFYDGHLEYVPKNQLISIELAKQVALHFFDTGTLLRGLSWEGAMEEYM